MDFMRVESMTNAELLEEFKWLEHMQDCIVMMPEYLIRFEELDHEMTRREELQLL